MNLLEEHHHQHCQPRPRRLSTSVLAINLIFETLPTSVFFQDAEELDQLSLQNHQSLGKHSLIHLCGLVELFVLEEKMAGRFTMSCKLYPTLKGSSRTSRCPVTRSTWSLESKPLCPEFGSGIVEVANEPSKLRQRTWRRQRLTALLSGSGIDTACLLLTFYFKQ